MTAFADGHLISMRHKILSTVVSTQITVDDSPPVLTGSELKRHLGTEIRVTTFSGKFLPINFTLECRRTPTMLTTSLDSCSQSQTALTQLSPEAGKKKHRVYIHSYTHIDSV